MSETDPISQLLKSTGWTPDDLLKRLAIYKTDPNLDSDKCNENEEVSKSLAESIDHLKNSDNTSKTSNTSILKDTDPESEDTVLFVNDSTNSATITPILRKSEEELKENAESKKNNLSNLKSSSYMERINLDEYEKNKQDDSTYAEDDDDDDFFEETCGTHLHFNIVNTFEGKKQQNLEDYEDSDESVFSDESFVLRLDPDTDKENSDENVYKELDVSIESSLPKEDDNSNKGTNQENNAFISDNIVLKSLQNCAENSDENVYKELDVSLQTSPPKEDDNSKKVTNRKIDHLISDNKVSKDLQDCADNDASSEINNKKAHDDLVREKCSANVEGNTPAGVTYEDEDDDYHEEEPIQSPEKLEEIRRNLKMQLSSLRTRKKSNILPKLVTTFFDEENHIEHRLNVSSFSKHHMPSKNIDTNSLTAFTTREQVNLNQESSNSKHSEDEESDSLGLVISCIQGGVEDIDTFISESTEVFPQPVMTNQNSNANNNLNTEQQEEFKDSDVPNVLKDLRKIIRKKKCHPEFIKECKHNDSSSGNITDVASVDKVATFIKSKPNKESPVQTTKNTKSPFVSNTLDEFLNENSKLNISYKLPMLDAEKGIRSDSYNEDNLLLIKKVQDAEERHTGMPKKENLAVPKIKAKTLAEKRKLLEKVKRKDVKNFEQNINTQLEKRSYVLYNDKKIWVRSKIPGQCLAEIGYTRKPVSKKSELVEEPKSVISPEKPSLLKDMYKQKYTKIKYKPGPLCKKRMLQESNEQWKTEIKKLPKVLLEIEPKLGKPINPEIVHLLPQNNGMVSNTQIDYALSALITKDTSKINGNIEQYIYKFEVPYENNTEQIIVRRKQSTSSLLSVFSVDSRNKKIGTIEEEVSNVISDLVKYVEIKELAPSLIKEADTGSFEEKFDSKSKTSISDDISTIVKKNNGKRSRIDLELSRLNCKIVNVKVDKPEDIKNCEKQFCQLGCVCRSLACDAFIGNHCKNVKCMFECSCREKRGISYDEELNLPAGTDILSRDAVSRIEDQAKRDLAKIEREFTQTVICTNDKAIVVGIGGRNKSRRTTKVPKRYSDFAIDDLIESASEEKSEMTADWKLSGKCIVSVDNINLTPVIPYCLVHSLYYCHCKGESSVPLSETHRKKCSLTTKHTKDMLINKSHKKSSQFEYEEPKENSPDKEDVFFSVTGRPMRDPNKIKKKNYTDTVFDEKPKKVNKKATIRLSMTSESDTNLPDADVETFDVARTRFYERKKTSYLIPDDIKIKHDFVFNINEADILKIKIAKARFNDVSEAERLKVTLFDEFRRLVALNKVPAEDSSTPVSHTNNQIPATEPERKNKRKQTLQIRNDSDDIYNITITDSMAMQKTKNQLKNVFSGELLVTDNEWLQKIEENCSQLVNGCARLLPWKEVTLGHQSGEILIYCAIDYPYRLVFCKEDVQVPERYLNITQHGDELVNGPLKIKTNVESVLRQCEQVQKVIKWITSNELPEQYMPNMLSFLLVEIKKNQFEVRGLCNQVVNNSAINAPEQNTTETDPLDLHNVIELKHKGISQEIQTLYLTKETFDTRELIEDTLNEAEKRSFIVNLPHSYAKCKWRMIHLNREFAYLYFVTIAYSIKYTDLDNLSKKAIANKSTYILRNPKIMEAYNHKDFGIYFDPQYSDRIFIGPYFKEHSTEDIKTLRYFNKTLVNTEMFNRIQGRLDYKTGLWLVEPQKNTSTANPKTNISKTATVDLTLDDEMVTNADERRNLKRKSEGSNFSSPTKKNKTEANSNLDRVGDMNEKPPEHMIYHENEPIYIKSCEGRSPSDYNKFIITNIPGFGYLGAYKNPEIDSIEVSWPYEKKVLQFRTCDHAKSFLKHRFSQLLLPIPETFKIDVTILDTLNINCSKPINSEFLTGFCVCGEFGTLNYKTLTEGNCVKIIGISLDEVTKMFARRAQIAVRNQVDELAGVLEFDKKKLENLDIPDILNMAVAAIKKLKQSDIQLRADIKRGELQVIANIKRLYKMISELPTNERNMESKIFNEALKIRECKPRADDEVIEIPESDEEEVTNQTDSKPQPKVILPNTVVAGSSKPVPLLKKIVPGKALPKVAKVAPFSSSKKTIIISNYKSILKQNPTSSTQVTTNVSPQVSTVNPVASGSSVLISKINTVPNYQKEFCAPSTSKAAENVENPEITQPSGGDVTRAGVAVGSAVLNKKPFVRILPKPEFLNLADMSEPIGTASNSSKEYRLVKVKNGTVLYLPK